MPENTQPTGTLPAPLVAEAVRAALAEDLGLAGDITSQATLPVEATATATMSAREPGVIAGLPLAVEAFRQMGGVSFEPMVADGAAVAMGDVVARVSGNARAMLGGERVALNFVNHLSGIATLTREFVRAIEGSGARITDTRKTTPGLRAFQKYAVRCGGGSNHRAGLDDAILVKENHLRIAGGIAPAVAALRNGLPIEVEAETLADVAEALEVGVDRILLDNMSPATVAEAVELVAGRVPLEASGGMSLATVRAYAETGVDFISVGALTHSARSLHVSLEVE